MAYLFVYQSTIRPIFLKCEHNLIILNRIFCYGWSTLLNSILV